jgi:hypothetical protein
MEPALLARGFHYGSAPGSVVIGWNGGHAAVTLPDGTPVSSGESGSGVRIGGGGAYQPQFTHHMYLPVEAQQMNTEPAPPADAGPPAAVPPPGEVPPPPGEVPPPGESAAPVEVVPPPPAEPVAPLPPADQAPVIDLAAQAPDLPPAPTAPLP